MSHRKSDSRDHAYLSASGSNRWLNCTKSPLLEESFEDTTSIYAEEGTLAHNIGELILLYHTGSIDKAQFDIGMAKATTDDLFYEGMVNEVGIYTNYCIEKFNEIKVNDPLAFMDVEQRLDYSKYAPEGFGTGDCVIVGNNTVEVIDLKFGKGVVVDPSDNTQLMLYGLGALEAYDFLYEVETVILTVAQVRLQGMSSWSISIKDLLDWGEKVVKPKAFKAFNGKGEAVPGDWCMFCKFRNQCKARSSYLTKLYQDHKERDKETMSLEDLAYILDHEKLIKNWLSGIQDYALGLGLSGTKIPGYKVVEGRSNRRITDGEGLGDFLVSKGFDDDKVFRPKEVQTITALEKLVGKKDFVELSEGFIEKPEGRPTLVNETDRRKSIVQTPEDEFDFD